MIPAGTVQRNEDRLIAIGASAGGPAALEVILRQLESESLPVLVAQHMPENFTRAFARRMDEVTRVHVCEAEHSMVLRSGEVYIAPGGRHMRVSRVTHELRLMLSDDEPINRHKPSVDALFFSVVEARPRAALGVLLTGMGNDGAQGLKALRDAHYPTLIQDEASSSVWGMPGAAAKLGAARAGDIRSLDAIAVAVRLFALQK
jgi:two-component system chemotaxis response regulator CheB